MKKIPSLFARDWEGDKNNVTPIVTPGCEWVIEGEGTATRKWDGTCCMVRDGELFKRREIKVGKRVPVGFEPCEQDDVTGKVMGWVPVGTGPEDAIHRDTFAAHGNNMPDGTYELVGPKVNGNPERFMEHWLEAHGDVILDGAPRTFDELSKWFAARNIEGIVWHHPDGRMVKIKAKDFPRD